MLEHTNEPTFILVLDPVHHSAKAQVSALAEAARRLLDRAPVGEIRLVSPYLGYDILRPLVEGQPFRLVTDLEACCEAGAEDRLLRFLTEYRNNIRHVGDVHAKVVLTEGGVLFGSANLTTRALRVRQEMGCLILGPALSAPVRVWFEDLWSVGEPVDAARIAAAAERGHALVTARANTAPTNGRGAGSPQAPGGTARRTLGWMEPLRRMDRTPEQPSRSGSTPDEGAIADQDELVAQLRTLTHSRAECDRVLSLLARAIEVAGLPVDDDRLHLNFGKTAINVTINQRYVAWCSRERGISQFGFILDDCDIAGNAAGELDGAWPDHFGKGGADDPSTLHVPVRHLGDVTRTALQSWERAIRWEVERTRPDGSYCQSSFRRYKRPFLYYILTDPALRCEMAAQACAARCWWFGINNGSRGHVQLDQIRGLLDGRQREFVWPVGQSKPKKLYDQMRPGDRVLLWTGDGDNPRWGLLGTAAITASGGEQVVLGDAHCFADPITPYPKGNPGETEQVRFLCSTFGADFTPLGDVMRAVFKTERTPPITVALVDDRAFEAVSGRSRQPNGEREGSE